MSVAKPWRYKLAFWIFAVSLIVLGGRTIAGTLNWAWNAVAPADTTITTVYTPDPGPRVDYEWPQ